MVLKTVKDDGALVRKSERKRRVLSPLLMERSNTNHRECRLAPWHLHLHSIPMYLGLCNGVVGSCVSIRMPFVNVDRGLGVSLKVTSGSRHDCNQNMTNRDSKSHMYVSLQGLVRVESDTC